MAPIMAGVAGVVKMAAMIFSAVAISTARPAAADSAEVFAMTDLPFEGRNSLMTLALSLPASADYKIARFDVMPLTASSGLGQDMIARGSVAIKGKLVAADESNYANIPDMRNTTVYVSCDSTNDSFLEPNKIIGSLLASTPKAILLYSTKGNCCGIQNLDSPYQTMYTMIDGKDASAALNFTQQGSTDDLLATISGADLNGTTGLGDGSGSSNSAVAMSILYSITGLITLLFIVIIATGAIRAHRYPERYGPHAGYGGRPRQSRARGLARAVLETLPIVKFGDPAAAPAKPDPALELENQSVRLNTPEPNAPPAQADQPSQMLRAQSPNGTPQTNAASENTSTVPVSAAAAGTIADHGGAGNPAQEDDNPACSICTEDFLVGEDVRLLPCGHKFHPSCIDPWLVNVSGTCPLCRYDLRPKRQVERNQGLSSLPSSAETIQLPPPLEAEETDHEGSAVAQSSQDQRSRRSSRLLDLHRLRHASVEERIEILRRHRSQQAGAPDSGEQDPEERGRRAKLTHRLRERFHIRTREQTARQSPSQGGEA